MAKLYALQNTYALQFIYSCNACKARVETRYHCSVCEDFDLCVSCYPKENHKHRMEKLGWVHTDAQGEESRQVARELSIKRCLHVLVHSCHCNTNLCTMPSCLNMKEIIAHAKACKQESGCAICKELITLSYYHAKTCNEERCRVLFCLNIRRRLRLQQLQYKKNLHRFVYTCNACKAHVKAKCRYHCNVCKDFDICANCYGKGSHKHRIEKLGFKLDDGGTNLDQKPIKPHHLRESTIKQCVESLVHSSHCNDANCCTMPSCLNMKKIVSHVKACKRNTVCGCTICKSFITLGYHHAKTCKETKCCVLFCSNIRRRIAASQNHEMPSTVAQKNKEDSFSVSQPFSVAQPPTSVYSTQPLLDMRPRRDIRDTYWFKLMCTLRKVNTLAEVNRSQIRGTDTENRYLNE